MLRFWKLSYNLGQSVSPVGFWTSLTIFPANCLVACEFCLSAHALGGHDRVEGNREMFHRVRQKVIVNVRQYSKACTCVRVSLRRGWCLELDSALATVQRELLRWSSECLFLIFGGRVPRPTTELLAKAERASHLRS